MSRTRRNFSAKFKSELVIELLKGEKDLNTIASENNIQPNLLRNWKKEFLDKASVVFDDSREDNLKEKLALERKEKAEYAKKVGQLSPGSIGISPLSTPHRHPFQRMCVRSSIPFYGNFNLDMDRSPGFGSAHADFTPY